MRVSADWIDNAAFVAKTESGHAITVDGPPEGGGQNRGARPMELLLAGMACCAAYDVVSILTKGRQTPSSCQVRVEAERHATPPAVFTTIHMHFSLSGSLSEHQVERAISLSAEKYCSASIMLGKTAHITHSYDITDAAAPKTTADGSADD